MRNRLSRPWISSQSDQTSESSLLIMQPLIHTRTTTTKTKTKDPLSSSLSSSSSSSSSTCILKKDKLNHTPFLAFLSSLLENPFSTLTELSLNVFLKILHHPWTYQCISFFTFISQLFLLLISLYTLPRTLCKFISFVHMYCRTKYPFQPFSIVIKNSFVNDWLPWISNWVLQKRHHHPDTNSITNTTTIAERPPLLTLTPSLSPERISLNNIPPEIISQILLHCSPEAIFHFGFTCKANYQLATCPLFWSLKLKLDFPGIPHHSYSYSYPALSSSFSSSLTSLSSNSAISHYRIYRNAIYFDCSCTLCKQSDTKKAPWAFFCLHDTKHCQCLAHASFPKSMIPYYHHFMCTWKEYYLGFHSLLHQEAKVAWFHLHHVLFTPFKLLAALWLPLIFCCTLRFQSNQRTHQPHGLFGFYAKELYLVCINRCNIWNLHWLTLLVPILFFFLAMSEFLALLSFITTSRHFQVLHSRFMASFFWFTLIVVLFSGTWVCQRALWEGGKQWSQYTFHRLISW